MPGLAVRCNGFMTTLPQRLARLDSTVVSDALDTCGLTPGSGEVTAQWEGARLSGTVRTVELEPDPGDAPGPHIATTVVASAGPGDVVVVANSGRTDVSAWGGLLSLASGRRGVAGVVVDGACRDVRECRELGFAVFARGVTPRSARGRLRQKAVAQPVVIAGIEVEDGDLVIADDSGVVFVPRRFADAVLDAAEQIAARERAIAADLRADAPASQAMHDARLAGRSPRGDSTSQLLGPAGG